MTAGIPACPAVDKLKYTSTADLKSLRHEPQFLPGTSDR